MSESASACTKTWMALRHGAQLDGLWEEGAVLIAPIRIYVFCHLPSPILGVSPRSLLHSNCALLSFSSICGGPTGY